MLFVSVSPELEVIIRPDVPGTRQNAYNQTEHFSQRPVLYARFQPKKLDFGQRVRADLEFKRLNPEHPYGATPFRDKGIMGSQFAEEDISESDPEAFAGYDPVHMLGKFDTATDIEYDGQPEAETDEGRRELRKLVESKLLADTSFNGPQGFILLDGVTVERPWPNYPLEGQGRHKKIEAMVRELGVDVYAPMVVAFESAQDKPGEGVISTMEALLDEHKGVLAENEALGAEIPA